MPRAQGFIDAASAGAGWVGLEPALPRRMCSPSLFHASPKWNRLASAELTIAGRRSARMPRASVSQCLCPFVDRIVCGQGDDDRIDYFYLRSGRARLTPADRGRECQSPERRRARSISAVL
jgi:hypothetical protein